MLVCVAFLVHYGFVGKTGSKLKASRYPSLLARVCLPVLSTQTLSGTSALAARLGCWVEFHASPPEAVFVLCRAHTGHIFRNNCVSVPYPICQSFAYQVVSLGPCGWTAACIKRSAAIPNPLIHDLTPAPHHVPAIMSCHVFMCPPSDSRRTNSPSSGCARLTSWSRTL